MTEKQQSIMKFDPCYRTARPYPSHAAQYREHWGQKAWLYNPWNGNKRHPSDIGTDVLGMLIDQN